MGSGDNVGANSPYPQMGNNGSLHAGEWLTYLGIPSSLGEGGVRFLRMALWNTKPSMPPVGSIPDSQTEGDVVVPSDFLQIAEGLNHLDPVRTYPTRAAKLVADLANATAFRVELEQGDKRKLDSTPPPPNDGRVVSLPLRHGRQVLGTIHLFLREGTEKLEGHDLRLARWGARALARGLTYSHRMNRPSLESRRRSHEVQSRLDRTPLTKREKEVVVLLVSGGSTRQIAEQTGLTVATVHTYLKRIYSKLGVHSRVELVARMVGTNASSSVMAGGEEPDDDMLDVEDDEHIHDDDETDALEAAV
jgi:DNA-binding CsgD family transcriptional regulator